MKAYNVHVIQVADCYTSPMIDMVISCEKTTTTEPSTHQIPLILM